jgi:hypothetical protein
LLSAASYDTIKVPVVVTSRCLCRAGNMLGKSYRMTSYFSNASVV